MPSDVSLPPETLDLLKAMAFIHLQHGRAQDAVALLRAARRANGCLASAHILLALAELRCGLANDALATLSGAEPETRGIPSFHIVQARALRDLGRQNDARTAMKRYLQTRTLSASSLRAERTHAA